MQLAISRAERDAVLAGLAKIVTQIYGPRCTDNEAGCLGCTAWGVYDLVDRLTDSSLLDEQDLQKSEGK